MKVIFVSLIFLLATASSAVAGWHERVSWEITFDLDPAGNPYPFGGNSSPVVNFPSVPGADSFMLNVYSQPVSWQNPDGSWIYRPEGVDPKAVMNLWFLGGPEATADRPLDLSDGTVGRAAGIPVQVEINQQGTIITLHIPAIDNNIPGPGPAGLPPGCCFMFNQPQPATTLTFIVMRGEEFTTTSETAARGEYAAGWDNSAIRSSTRTVSKLLDVVGLFGGRQIDTRVDATGLGSSAGGYYGNDGHTFTRTVYRWFTPDPPKPKPARAK
jgi:hypothetical protein